MQINLTNAIKKFYPNPVLEQVYFEAIANSIYANATEITLDIFIESYSQPHTFKMTITDNGEGFTDENYRKFCSLLETDDEEHKGLGRLVFLNYFKNVTVSSVSQNRKRVFKYSKTFDADNFSIVDASNEKNETILEFTHYLKDRIYTYDFLTPSAIKKAIELHFFPLFHQYKKESKDLDITIRLKTEEANSSKLYNDVQKIVVKKIPTLRLIQFPAEYLSLQDEFELYYSVKKTKLETSIITAICAEGRTLPLEILSKDNIPDGYEIIFLLYSTFFDGKVNSSRQKLDVENYIWKTIKTTFILQISTVFKEEIPSIDKRNQKTKENLLNKYPHYYGFFDDNSVGLIKKDKSLEMAQKRFFQAQKKIMEATTLTDKQYQQAIGISSRLLTEYILYRNIIIEKLKTIDIKNNEQDIHNIIVPRASKLKGKDIINDIYTNNAWLLDDKFMTYSTILSERRMDELISEITQGESKEDSSGRPDISMIFSDNPNETNSKIDVVIIELKKLGLRLASKEELVSQLKQRARRLLKYYPNKIQRIWFYGIIDFSPEFILSLKESKYFEIYSKDKVFYGEETVISIDDNSKSTFIGINLLSFEAFWKDAESRNSTFLKILKDGFKKEK